MRTKERQDHIKKSYKLQSCFSAEATNIDVARFEKGRCSTSSRHEISWIEWLRILEHLSRNQNQMNEYTKHVVRFQRSLMTPYIYKVSSFDFKFLVSKPWNDYAWLAWLNTRMIYFFQHKKLFSLKKNWWSYKPEQEFLLGFFISTSNDRNITFLAHSFSDSYRNLIPANIY